MLRNYRVYLLGTFALLGASWTMLSGCHSSTTPPPVVAPRSFLVTPLAADKANVSSYGTVASANIDANLQDAWGLTVSSGYFWIANAGSGMTTYYDSTGASQKPFVVPGPGATKGTPTGIVSINGQFIFCSLNGTLSQLSGFSDSAKIVLDRSSTSSNYTGLALANGSNGPLFFAANPKNWSLDPFDHNFNPQPQIPGKYFAQGYAPFNAVVIDTQLFVTHAKRSATTPPLYVVLGTGNGGYVDIYHLDGTFEGNLITNDSLDQPWGVAIAPSNFGSYSGDLLVGNFGDGKIHAFNRSTGALLGTLNGANGAPIAIDGLWALVVYNGTLYYTAGPNNGVDGVFGTITVR